MLVILALQPCVCVCACAFQFGPSVEALGLAIAFDNLAWVLWLALHSALPATCPRKHCDDKVFLRRSCLYVLSYGARRMMAGPRHACVILCHARLLLVRGDCLCRRFAPVICRVYGRILVGRQFGFRRVLAGLGADMPNNVDVMRYTCICDCMLHAPSANIASKTGDGGRDFVFALFLLACYFILTFRPAATLTILDCLTHFLGFCHIRGPSRHPGP